MTVKVTDLDGLLECLDIVRDGIAAGKVSGVSLHYEPTGAARLSITWICGHEDIPTLPGVPMPDPYDEDTQR